MFTSKDLASSGAHAAMAAPHTENPAAAGADGGVENSADASRDSVPLANAQAIIVSERHRRDLGDIARARRKHRRGQTAAARLCNSGDLQMASWLRFSDLQARGIAKSWAQLRRLIKLYGFPPGRMVSPNTRAWSSDDIDAYYASRPVAGPELRGAAKQKRDRARRASLVAITLPVLMTGVEGVPQIKLPVAAIVRMETTPALGSAPSLCSLYQSDIRMRLRRPTAASAISATESVTA